jgi:hypothetical protein
MTEIVYVLSNPAMIGLLKIGMTDNKNLHERMKQLYTTGVPLPFDCVYAGIVEDNLKVEKLIHQKFEKKRLNPNREFFTLKARTVVKALKTYEIEDMTPEFRKKIDAPLTEAEKRARRSVRRKAEKIDSSIPEAKNLHITITASKKVLS